MQDPAVQTFKGYDLEVLIATCSEGELLQRLVEYEGKKFASIREAEMKELAEAKFQPEECGDEVGEHFAEDAQDGPLPDEAMRRGVRIAVQRGRVTGKLVTWGGDFGWIVPDVPINHPAAAKHGGRVYVGPYDLEREISGAGARVSFFLFCAGLAGAPYLFAERMIPARANRGSGSDGGGRPPRKRWTGRG